MEPATPPPALPRALTVDELARQRRRSVALATVLGVLVFLFYVVTLVKTGSAPPVKP